MIKFIKNLLGFKKPTAELIEEAETNRTNYRDEVLRDGKSAPKPLKSPPKTSGSVTPATSKAKRSNDSSPYIHNDGAVIIGADYDTPTPERKSGYGSPFHEKDSDTNSNNKNYDHSPSANDSSPSDSGSDGGGGGGGGE